MSMEKIEARFSRERKPNAKKQVCYYITDSQLEKLEKLAAIMEAHSGRKVSRNALIVDAVKAFLESSEEFLKEEYGFTGDDLQNWREVTK
jgi:hypothetical protein